MKNIGQTPAEVGGLIANVYGRRFTQRNGDEVNSPTRGLITRNRTLARTSPVFLYSFFDVWRPLGDQRSFVLEPSQEIQESFDFAIRAGQYDVARVATMLCYARPGVKPRPVLRESERDGSFSLHFIDGLPNSSGGLRCFLQGPEYRV